MDPVRDNLTWIQKFIKMINVIYIKLLQGRYGNAIGISYL